MLAAQSEASTAGKCVQVTLEHLRRSAGLDCGTGAVVPAALQEEDMGYLVPPCEGCLVALEGGLHAAPRPTSGFVAQSQEEGCHVVLLVMTGQQVAEALCLGLAEAVQLQRAAEAEQHAHEALRQAAAGLCCTYVMLQKPYDAGSLRNGRAVQSVQQGLAVAAAAGAQLE